jgi:hypothetical protein
MPAAALIDIIVSSVRESVDALPRTSGRRRG